MKRRFVRAHEIANALGLVGLYRPYDVKSLSNGAMLVVSAGLVQIDGRGAKRTEIPTLGVLSRLALARALETTLNAGRPVDTGLLRGRVDPWTRDPIAQHPPSSTIVEPATPQCNARDPRSVCTMLRNAGACVEKRRHGKKRPHRCACGYEWRAK